MDQLFGKERADRLRKQAQQKRERVELQLNQLNEQILDLTQKIEERDAEISRLKQECNELREENQVLKLRIIELEKERDSYINQRTELIHLNGYLIPPDAEVFKENNDVYVRHQGYYWSHYTWMTEKRPVGVTLVKTDRGYGVRDSGMIKNLWEGQGNPMFIKYDII